MIFRLVPSIEIITIFSFKIKDKFDYSNLELKSFPKIIQASTHSELNTGIYSLGKLPDLSKLDLHTLQYNLISFDGNSAPQFLHV